jgi:hypothetical protein
MFQNCVEIHMQRIQLGLGQCGSLDPFMIQHAWGRLAIPVPSGAPICASLHMSVRRVMEGGAEHRRNGQCLCLHCDSWWPQNTTRDPRLLQQRILNLWSLEMWCQVAQHMGTDLLEGPIYETTWHHITETIISIEKPVYGYMLVLHNQTTHSVCITGSWRLVHVCISKPQSFDFATENTSVLYIELQCMVSYSKKAKNNKKKGWCFYMWLYLFSRIRSGHKSQERTNKDGGCWSLLTHPNWTVHLLSINTNHRHLHMKSSPEHKRHLVGVGRRKLQGRWVREGSAFVLSLTWFHLVIWYLLLMCMHVSDTNNVKLNFKFGSMRLLYVLGRYNSLTDSGQGVCLRPLYADGESRYNLYFVCVRVTSWWGKATEGRFIVR